LIVAIAALVVMLVGDPHLHQQQQQQKKRGVHREVCNLEGKALMTTTTTINHILLYMPPAFSLLRLPQGATWFLMRCIPSRDMITLLCIVR